MLKLKTHYNNKFKLTDNETTGIYSNTMHHCYCRNKLISTMIEA